MNRFYTLQEFIKMKNLNEVAKRYSVYGELNGKIVQYVASYDDLVELYLENNKVREHSKDDTEFVQRVLKDACKNVLYEEVKVTITEYLKEYDSSYRARLINNIEQLLLTYNIVDEPGKREIEADTKRLYQHFRKNKPAINTLDEIFQVAYNKDCLITMKNLLSLYKNKVINKEVLLGCINYFNGDTIYTKYRDKKINFDEVIILKEADIITPQRAYNVVKDDLIEQYKNKMYNDDNEDLGSKEYKSKLREAKKILQLVPSAELIALYNNSTLTIKDLYLSEINIDKTIENVQFDEIINPNEVAKLYIRMKNDLNELTKETLTKEEIKIKSFLEQNISNDEKIEYLYHEQILLQNNVLELYENGLGSTKTLLKIYDAGTDFEDGTNIDYDSMKKALIMQNILEEYQQEKLDLIDLSIYHKHFLTNEQGKTEFSNELAELAKQRQQLEQAYGINLVFDEHFKNKKEEQEIVNDFLSGLLSKEDFITYAKKGFVGLEYAVIYLEAEEIQADFESKIKQQNENGEISNKIANVLLDKENNQESNLVKKAKDLKLRGYLLEQEYNEILANINMLENIEQGNLSVEDTIDYYNKGLLDIVDTALGLEELGQTQDIKESILGALETKTLDFLKFNSLNDALKDVSMEKENYISREYANLAYVVGAIEDNVYLHCYHANIITIGDISNNIQDSSEIVTYIKEYNLSEDKIEELFWQGTISTKQVKELEQEGRINAQKVNNIINNLTAEEMRERLLATGDYEEVEDYEKDEKHISKGQRTKGQELKIEENPNVINPVVKDLYFEYLGMKPKEENQRALLCKNGSLKGYKIMPIPNTKVVVLEKMFEETKSGEKKPARKSATLVILNKDIDYIRTHRRKELIEVANGKSNNVTIARRLHTNGWGYNVLKDIEEIEGNPISSIIGEENLIRIKRLCQEIKKGDYFLDPVLYDL